MATELIAWIPAVQADVAGAPRAMMLDAIRQAAIEFCERTRAWRYELASFNTALDDDDARVAQYTLTVPTGSRVLSIRSLSYAGLPLTEKSMDWLDENEPGWRTKEGTPRNYVLRDNGIILLDRLPPEGVAITGTVALKPLQDGTEIGDNVYQDYREAIAAGAIYRLRMMPGKDWYEPNLAALKLPAFEAGVALANSRDNFTTRRRNRVRVNNF